MTVQVLQEPSSQIETPTIVNVVYLRNEDDYMGLRKGNVIATSEGFALYFDDNNLGKVFAGKLDRLGPTAFMFRTPYIHSGVLNVGDHIRGTYSNILECPSSAYGGREGLAKVLTQAGIPI